MKNMKMKGVVSVESPSYAVYEDPRTRFRHMSLLQDYEELEKETEAMKSKLQNLKLRKSTLSAEVRFLRRRYKYLKENQYPKPQLKQDIAKPPKFETRAPTITKGRNYNRKGSILRPSVIVSGLNNPKERNYNRVDRKVQKLAPVLDLNQNARNLSGTDAGFVNYAPMLDLNKEEQIYSGKESTKQRAPIFDLNQISREEEELQGNPELLRIEEPKKSIQRGLIDEKLNETKLSVCRNLGNGSSRAGKRKISWQDQVALGLIY
ncbi:Ribosomal RNA small subunit methyltransferase G [Quillaja saponaria]|uniref:Ribosomal RNA small subunit methyltransferase G n=1 Tax=Quillaja saponaria TaxID=32244 RepID=A0AAD7VKU6_QUISA|nr:Ribosomal RNA small subunit methyltransferase G [Quillaja saponaria]